MMRDRLPYYIQLMRLDKPIGVLLLLWPTLSALWIAAQGCTRFISVNCVHTGCHCDAKCRLCNK